jgi:usherin
MLLLINFYILSAPSGFDRIVVLERGSRYITVSWDPPAAPNGIIVNYTVLMGDDVIIATPPDVLQYMVSPLLPFSMYTFSVMACTSAGCVESQEIQSTTLEDGEIHTCSIHNILLVGTLELVVN